MSENLKNKIDDIAKAIETKGLLESSLSDWRNRLAQECQVYVFGSRYLAKPYDRIEYKFCTLDMAKEILIDNAYALLRYKYFTKQNDAVDQRIKEIVNSFVANLKTSLIKVTMNEDDCGKVIKWVPNGCVAFRNGVYDFKNNDWLFKYQIIPVPEKNNSIYMYDPNYIVNWYVNIEFEPYDYVSVKDQTIYDYVDCLKEMISVEKDNTKYGCFKLMYNMAFDIRHNFSMRRFIHLSEIMGYLCYQSFVQKFVLLVGSGQNGKNSLLDGCFSNRIEPKPASVDMGSIETDKFGNSVFENKFQNIYLETSSRDDVYKDNTNLKALTGSTDQMVEYKGKDKQNGYINCKFLWSANDQDKIKFSDTTEGFKRRINIFEIWYHWDKDNRYMSKGEYYESNFSEDLSELKDDLENIKTLIYLAMFGTKIATCNFTKSFNFIDEEGNALNDWNDKYTDLDLSLREDVNNLSTDDILRWIRNPENRSLATMLFYDPARKRWDDSGYLTELSPSYRNLDGVCKFLENIDDVTEYFVDNYLYMNIQGIQSILYGNQTVKNFSSKLKKTFGLREVTNLTNNRAYVKCKFYFGKLKILSE